MSDKKLISESPQFLSFTQLWATISITILGAFLAFQQVSSDPKCRGLFIIMAFLLALSFFCAMLSLLLSARFNQFELKDISVNEEYFFCFTLSMGCWAFVVAMVFMFLLFLSSPYQVTSNPPAAGSVSSVDIHKQAVALNSVTTHVGSGTAVKSFIVLGIVLGIGLVCGIAAQRLARLVHRLARDKQQKLPETPAD